MQIHEITTNSKPQLDEALPNWMDPAVIAQKAGQVGQGIKNIGQNVKSTYAPAQQALKTRQQTKAAGNVAAKAIAAWDNYTKQLKAATPDPTRYQQLYKQALTSFVQKNLLRGQSIANAINKQEITQLIDAMAAQADNPQQVAQLFPKLIQQAALAQPDAATASQSLVRVINPDPAVLQFRNKTYIINDQGEWADQVTGAVADQSFQAFLDQELAKVVPNAQAQTAPKPTTPAQLPARGTP
jgi:hypothetical protein